jgi:hypothetical protein
LSAPPSSHIGTAGAHREPLGKTATGTGLRRTEEFCTPCDLDEPQAPEPCCCCAVSCRRCWYRARDLAYRWLRNYDDAEDAAQEAVFRLWQRCLRGDCRWCEFRELNCRREHCWCGRRCGHCPCVWLYVRASVREAIFKRSRPKYEWIGTLDDLSIYSLSLLIIQRPLIY